MIRFHSTYERAADIQQRLIDHLETLRIDGQLCDTAYDAPYRWIDLINATTALYLSSRKFTDRQIAIQISGLTQERIDRLRFDASPGSNKFFPLLTKTDVIATFEPFSGTVRLRGKTFFIDLFDRTIKPARFDDLITMDTLDFHVNRLAGQLELRGYDLQPSREAIRSELQRVSGIDMGFYARKIPAHLQLFEGVMPIEIHYMPNSVINNMPRAQGYRENIALLKEMTRHLQVHPESGQMPSSYGLCYCSESKESGVVNPVAVSIHLSLQYDSLTNLLAPAIELRNARVHCMIPNEQGHLYQAGDEATIRSIAETCAMQLNANIAKDQKMVENTQKRRRAKLESSGGSIKIDRVAQCVLNLIDELDPEKGQDVRSGKIKNVKIRTDQAGEFFSGHAARKDNKINRIMISFRIRDGNFHARFEVSDGYIWENDRLLIHPPMPEVIVASLKHKQAKDILEHPLANLLGRVSQSRNIAGNTEIRFEKIIDDLQ